MVHEWCFSAIDANPVGFVRGSLRGYRPDDDDDEGVDDDDADGDGDGNDYDDDYDDAEP